MEYKVDGACVVLNIQPVAYVLALAIDRKRLLVADVVDEQRYQFLRKLVGPLIVRAICYDGRHTGRVKEGQDEKV